MLAELSECGQYGQCRQMAINVKTVALESLMGGETLLVWLSAQGHCDSSLV